MIEADHRRVGPAAHIEASCRVGQLCPRQIGVDEPRGVGRVRSTGYRTKRTSESYGYVQKTWGSCVEHDAI